MLFNGSLWTPGIELLGLGLTLPLSCVYLEILSTACSHYENLENSYGYHAAEIQL